MGNNKKRVKGEGSKARKGDLQDGDVVAIHACSSGGPAIRVRALQPPLHGMALDLMPVVVDRSSPACRSISSLEETLR